MKRVLYFIFITAFIVTSISIYADEETTNTETKEEVKKEVPVKTDTPKRKTVTSTIPVFTALTLNIGMTYPTGDIAGDGGQGSLVGLAYGFTLEGGYKFTPEHAITGSLGLSINDLKTEATFMGSTQTSTITAQHIDVGVGYRYFFNVFYLESGLTFGIPVGTWVKVSELNGNETETDIEESRCKMKLGLFGGFGYIRPINELVYFQASIRFNVSFLPVYDDGDTVLRDNNVMVLCGAGHHF